MKSLGIIAGNGQFPLLLAQEARRQGRTVVAIGLKEETDPKLEAFVDKFHWVKLGQLKKTLELLKEENIAEAVMAGQVKHTQLFRGLQLDLMAIKILATVKDKKTDTILGAIADEFAKSGIQLLPSTTYLRHLLAPKGFMTSARPNSGQKKDIEFGFKTAKEIAGLDLGQTVCVRDQAVLAVEAIEGTDACIRRAGSFCDGEFTVVKVAKPRQDVRFDMPVIGERTLESLREAKARVLAVEAGKTLFFDKDHFLKEADKLGIVVVGTTGD